MNDQHQHDGCDCGCEDEELVMLEDENGNEVAFHHVTTMEYEGKEYVFLQSANPEDEGIVEIFELEEDEKEDCDHLYAVDDETYDVLFKMLMDEMGEDECCCDDECDCHHEHGECDCGGHEHKHGHCDCGCEHDD